MTRQRWLLLAIAAALVTGGGVLAWRLLRAVPVPLAQVTRAAVMAQVDGPGTVQARVPVTLSARLTSTVVRVAADVGDRVAPGQVLVVLEARDLAARHDAVLRQQDSMARQVDAAAAALRKADAELELARVRERRDADLQQQGFVSRASLDASLAGARSAEAALQSAAAALAARRADQAALAQELLVARAQVGYTRLAAPMPGIVIQRLAEPGTTVAPGTPILR
ncbi:MAG: hypothetical protein EOO54_27155, partial [Haliea sp.]